MKKICFKFFIILAVSLFTMFSCTKSSSLYDIIISVMSENKDMPSGTVMCYGRMHDDSVSFDTLDEYLGLEGYPSFADKIDELCVFSAIGKEYAELAAMRLYRASDIADGVLLFERRIKAAERAKMFDFDMHTAKNAYISVYGNTIVLFMTDSNEEIQKKIDKLL